MEVAVAQILGLLTRPGHHKVYFVNAHCANQAACLPAYHAALGKADLLYADGAGMRLASRLLNGRAFCDNINGTDLLPRLCAALAASNQSLFLLGARIGVARRLKQVLQTKWPGLQVVGAEHGYHHPEEQPELLQRLAASKAQVLLVAMGVPHQELWIDAYAHRCGVQLALGVGAWFDFYTGDVPRAPKWMRARGLEWLWRLGLEPKRLARRYLLGNPHFAARVLAARWRLR